MCVDIGLIEGKSNRARKSGRVVSVVYMGFRSSVGKVWVHSERRENLLHQRDSGYSLTVQECIPTLFCGIEKTKM